MMQERNLGRRDGSWVDDSVRRERQTILFSYSLSVLVARYRNPKKSAVCGLNLKLQSSRGTWAAKMMRRRSLGRSAGSSVDENGKRVWKQ